CNDVVDRVLLPAVAAATTRWPKPQKAGGDDQFAHFVRGGLPGDVLVARELLFDKAVVRLIGVERVHKVIAVAPRFGTVTIKLEAIGIGVTCKVHPVTRPALAIVRRS